MYFFVYGDILSQVFFKNMSTLMNLGFWFQLSVFLFRFHLGIQTTQSLFPNHLDNIKSHKQKFQIKSMVLKLLIYQSWCFFKYFMSFEKPTFLHLYATCKRVPYCARWLLLYKKHGKHVLIKKLFLWHANCI
jgi:hypothetical protein